VAAPKGLVFRGNAHANFPLRRGRDVRDSPNVELQPKQLRREWEFVQSQLPEWRQHLHVWFLLPVSDARRKSGRSQRTYFSEK
jgi:hypothetical protein